MFIYRYLRQLGTGRMVLWCYLIWYLVTCAFHFDPSPRLWLSSLGLSAIIGCGLMLSVTAPPDRWQTLRLFLMPFCVSSFAALIKDRGFILIVSPVWQEAAVTAGACLLFCALVVLARQGSSPGP
ncbi:MAG TPA: hypothetical protein VLI06_13175 [Solimonas sp.]|nr:hypothetical protein [Solimonas sp.]